MSNAVPAAAHSPSRSIVIEPAPGWAALRLAELWEFRELLYFLTWRDIKVRYKRATLGAAWAVLQPLATMAVFTLFFGRLGRMPSDGMPYPVFAFSGLIPWQLFAFALSESSNSLVANERLITKVYFPRLLVPMSAVVAGLADFAIAFLLLLILMLVYGVRPPATIALLPAFVLLAVITALGVGLWLSALNVKYRDVRYTLPFLSQFWLLATPVAYPSSIVPEVWRPLYGLNPMAGVVDGFRWALLGMTPPSFVLLAVSTVVAIAGLVSGAMYFRRVERSFADII